MYSVSDAFLAALTQSHQATFKVEILSAGQVINTVENDIDPQGVRTEFGIVGGSITVDSTANVWRSGHVKFVDPTGAMIPSVSTDQLAPFGNGLRVYRGIKIDGVAEYVPLITGTIFNVQVDETPNGFVIDCDVYDRSRLVSAAKWADVYNIASGTNVITAMLGILQDRLPANHWSTMVPQYTATTETTPLLVLGGTGSTDPWQDVQNLAASIGMIVYFDPLGNPVIRAQPDPQDQSPVDWTVTEGSNLTGIKRRITAEDTYNGAIVTGENTSSTGAGYWAVAWDTDTTSPTYYLGPFGKRPAPPFVDPKVNSQNACQAAANARLLTLRGLANIVSTTCVPNPALEALDVVMVTRERLGVDAVPHVVSGFTVPLDVSTSMDLAYRKRQ